ncbi:M48 family metallopeptidase [Candidatus Gracilibacteria bacterium]|nr:M48 family metallopeptidase [Candidatus Gracilibacteria bacterium]
MQIEITKSWRKSLSLRFDRDGVLQVKAPKLTSRSSIHQFIQKNQGWIEKQHQKIQEQKREKKWYLFGEPLSILSYKERGNSNFTAASFSLEGKEFKIEVSGERASCKQELEKFYKTQAREYIPERCKELAELHGFQYNKLRITSAMTRWGSCSSKKNLNFSYRLIMAPKSSIDYVIIHELCHLRQMNHSPKFWKEVSDIMPEYKKYEKHLRDDGWKYRI